MRNLTVLFPPNCPTVGRVRLGKGPLNGGAGWDPGRGRDPRWGLWSRFPEKEMRNGDESDDICQQIALVWRFFFMQSALHHVCCSLIDFEEFHFNFPSYFLAFVFLGFNRQVSWVWDSDSHTDDVGWSWKMATRALGCLSQLLINRLISSSVRSETLVLQPCSPDNRHT